MSSDGVIFRFLGKVNKRFQTPVVGTIIAGLLTALMTLIFDLKELVDMMSIGTLMAYSIVAACVLLLRYQKSDEDDDIECNARASSLETVKDVLTQIFNFKRLKSPTILSGGIVAWEVLIFFVASLALTACIVHAAEPLSNYDALAIFGVSFFTVCLLLIIASIALQAPSKKGLSFKVPLVPLLPGLSVVINIYLMMMLSSDTWVRFGVWMAIGFIIYFGYGIWQEWRLSRTNVEVNTTVAAVEVENE
jgi:amino acid transporter